ncbi:MAG: reverse transcriptase/maturase family protein [Candidatus Aenigmatarchaeota archaeon]
MKTYDNLFPDMCSFGNLHSAYLKARKGKRFKEDVLDFSYNLEPNLLQLKRELESQEYRHGGYKIFFVEDSKKRTIKAAPFRDRVVHHALCNVIEPIFEKTFIHDSYACRKGKGTHAGVRRLAKFVRSRRFGYYMKCDIRKYFPSINHKILFSVISKRIKDEKVLRVVREIIDSAYDGEDRGIPIGNLTSQLFANIYLNEFDCFAKHTLGIRFYARYVDDFIFLEQKSRLLEIKKGVIVFLETIRLEIHEESALPYPVAQGIDFTGYRIFATHIALRKSFIKKVKRKIESASAPTIQSWNAHAEHADSYCARRNLFSSIKGLL